mmetsp:Transcript_34899/g.71239  ORF Transcript_34899/g.71239 Transcript_34899/m.71239 type:complete len:513 (-) Transcript_34899:114-1652(-)
MVKETNEEKSLGVITRQFGHLPEPGWRPSINSTPIEAWEGLVLEDDNGLLGWCGAECLFRFGDLFSSCGPLNRLCHSLAWCRRAVVLCLGCCAVNCCRCVIPSWARRNKRRARALVLPHQGVTGSLPRKPGPGLRAMKQLVLFDNALHGNLKSIGHFWGLKALNLSSNRLTGRLPPALCLLRSLRLLDLHGNAFTGPLDEQCSKCRLHSLFRLTHVSLAENQFDGPFPTSLLKMPWLMELHLSGCRLTGLLPHCQTLRNLRVLDLSFNVFTGPIPDYGTPKKASSLGFTDIIKMRRLSHRHRSSKSALPVEQAVNSHEDSQLIGIRAQNKKQAEQRKEFNKKERAKQPKKKPFLRKRRAVTPHDAKRLEQAQVVAPCAKLRDLRLTRNRLTGHVPHGFGRLTNLARLDLGANKLTGLGSLSLMEWGNLTRLEHIDVSRNKLEGQIPLGLVSLCNLKVLRLENNRLTGNIPDVVSRLQNLSVLNLSQNSGLLLRDASEKWLKKTLKSTTEVSL